MSRVSRQVEHWRETPDDVQVRGVIAVGRLFDIIQRHMDQQRYEISERQVARAIGVSPTTLANWREPKKLIAKKHLESIAKVTGVPYERVLDALLDDIDYRRPSDPPAPPSSGGTRRTG